MRRVGGNFGKATRLALLGAAWPLVACSHVPDAVNPVAWYRDVTGSSKNDSQNDTGRNKDNLATGSDQDFPNLGEVPDAPNHASSGIDREKLQESLIADREHAKYTNEQLQAGMGTPGASPAAPVTATAVPPPAPGAAPSAAAAGPAATTTTTTTTTTATPATKPQQQGAVAPAATQDSSATTSSRSRAAASAPAESSLQSPTPHAVPQGEAAPPAPAPSNLAPRPVPATPVQAGSNGAPVLTPPAATAARSVQPALAMRTPRGASSAISVSVGDITFATGSAALSAAHRGPLSEIAGLYKQAGGKVRVVGHAERGATGDAASRQVAGLDLALDRANAVAQALSDLGVPANEISVEAAPTRGNEIPRAEVFMEY
jgi:outer membrane protein OmpA-like peptidoglycan-associated protein